MEKFRGWIWIHARGSLRHRIASRPEEQRKVSFLCFSVKPTTMRAMVGGEDQGSM
jgi:hypothetical protein